MGNHQRNRMTDEKEYNQQDQIQLELKLPCSFVFKKLQQMRKRGELKLQENVVCNFIGVSTIKLAGPKDQVSASKKSITDAEQQLFQKLINKKLDLSQQEVSFFIKKIKPLKLDDYLKKFECEIQIKEKKKSLSDCIISTLQFEDRQLNVVHADISKIECDAIVNSCNNLMSLGDVEMQMGVASKILDMAGANYIQFCETYIKANKILEYGKAISYQFPNTKIVKYIINVATPIYHSGEQTKLDLLSIEKNIQAIFIEANKNNIQTLALPILGGGACGFSFMQIVQNSLNCIINNLYSKQNLSVKIVYVTELSEQNLNKICQVLKEIFQPKQKIRQIKYQWQWELGGKLQNYDDEEINKQIDEKYEQFEKSKKTEELKLEFSFTKQPGTHIVDLKTMIIEDKDLSTKIQLSLQTQNNTNRFLFDNKPIDDVMNEYLMIQKLNNNLQFEIFYKKHKIIFNSNGEIHQFNEATEYKRKVDKILYQKNIKQNHQNILIGKNIELKNTRSQQIQYEILVFSFDIKVIDDLQKTIKEDIKQHTFDYTISIPVIKNEVFNDLKNYLVRNSIKSYGDIGNGANTTLQILKQEQNKIQEYIELFLENAKKYPDNWIPQDKNFIKVDLSSDSEEYKEIEAEFKKTDNGKIYKISRLQNQLFWENYQTELQKLQEYSISNLSNDETLTDTEQDRYLWHGVKYKHPKIIYESMKEAFNITYATEGCYWGTGIYFAQNASYSRDYSYQLTQADDSTYENKFVFLYCKVTTGKTFSYGDKLQQNLKRPPDGYNCVSGITCGSNVFVLYGMDVRRAYPEYEVIYE